MNERERLARQRLTEIGKAIERRAATAGWYDADEAIAEAVLMLDAWKVEFRDFLNSPITTEDTEG